MEQDNQIKELAQKAKEVIKKYKEEYPEVKMDDDYLALKITEEWGECLQAYLMLTDRGRQKGKDKEEIRQLFSEELADVFAYILLLADKEDIDITKALNDKWFKYLNG